MVALLQPRCNLVNLIVLRMGDFLARSAGCFNIEAQDSKVGHLVALKALDIGIAFDSNFNLTVCFSIFFKCPL